VEDQPKAEIGPVLRWHHPTDLGLDLDRVLDLDQSQSVAETGDVGVDREARLAEGNP
jgi:hypothetical protein